VKLEKLENPAKVIVVMIMIYSLWKPQIQNLRKFEYYMNSKQWWVVWTQIWVKYGQTQMLGLKV